jgi:hypothetical protein
MILRKRAIQLAGALALTISAAAPLIALELIPVHGSLKGTYTITQLQSSPPLYSGHATADGIVSSLGKATLVVDGQTTTDSSGNIVPVAGTWIATLTAANGDQVFLRYLFPANDNAAGKYTLSGEYTVTGGTGRFSGATGKGTYSAEGTYSLLPGLVDGKFAGSLEGDISTPGKK